MKIFLDVKQIKRWLQIAKQDPKEAALFHLAFNTGLRISDLLKLKIEDLLDGDGEIVRNLRIKTKKTKAWVDRPLRRDCRSVVHDYLATRSDLNPYLFPPGQIKTRFGVNTSSPMSRMTAHRIYKNYLRIFFPESMIVGASTHTPRRSMGKIISQKSGRIEPASKFLGHRSCVSTAAYIDMDGHEDTANEIVSFIEIGE